MRNIFYVDYSQSQERSYKRTTRNTKKWLNILLKYFNFKHCKIFKVCLTISLMLWKNIKSYGIKSTLKKNVLAFSFFSNMEDKKVEILLKVIERVYTKNPAIQKLIDKSIIDICKEDKKIMCHLNRLFLLFFAVGFIVMGYQNINFVVCEGQQSRKKSCRIF